MAHEPIRVLWARQHATIYPGLGVFLAGPTDHGGAGTRWRRVLIDQLSRDQRLDPTMVLVAPEPEGGRWKDIEIDTGRPKADATANAQIAWEWQYLGLCDVTVVWFETYWDGNIGPTTRFEFGYYFQEYLKNTRRRSFVVGGPEDAESVKWAQRMAGVNGLPWLQDLDALAEAIAQCLLRKP